MSTSKMSASNKATNMISASNKAPARKMSTEEEIAALADSPYLVLNEYHKSFKKNPSLKSRHYGVQVFWDLKFTPIAPLSPKSLRENILKALQLHEKKYFLEEWIYAFGDILCMTQNEKNLFNQAGFSLRHAQKRGSYCRGCDKTVPVTSKYEQGVKTDLAETLLLRRMILHAYDIGPPGNILLITANGRDFWPTIAELKDSGFKMMVATLPDADQILMRTADLTWHWEDMKNGKGPSHSTEPSTKARPIEDQFIALSFKKN